LREHLKNEGDGTPFDRPAWEHARARPTTPMRFGGSTVSMMDLPEIRPKWQVGRRFLPIVAAASTGVAVAVSAWLAVSVWEERFAKATFNDVADDYASVLQNGLDRCG
jgi:hypothetical protein